MGEREDNVYKAKLAEQAERYDGESSTLIVDTILAGNLKFSNPIQLQL